MDWSTEFEGIYREQYPRLLRWGRSLSNDGNLVQQAVTDALFAYYRRGKFEDDPSNYLRKSTHSHFQDLLRKKSPETCPLEDVANQDDPTAVPQMLSLLRLASRGLTQAERLVFISRHFEKQTYKEIAASMAQTDSWIQESYRTAISKMRQQLKAYQ